MVLFNHATREMTAKIVYYGPGLCGKTTNLMVIFDKLDPKSKGKMLSLATKTDRTLFFDLLPVEIGKVGPFTVKIQLYTVPGQVFYNETRKLVLKGADSVVFVADSQPRMLDANRESFANLLENLEENQIDPNDTPIIVQYNKRDLPGVMPVDQLQESLGFEGYPYAEASAIKGEGVMETFRLVSKITAKHLFSKLKGKSEPVKRQAVKPEARHVRVAEAPASGTAETVPEVNPFADSVPFPDAGAVDQGYERAEEVSLEQLLAEGRQRPSTLSGDVPVPVVEEIEELTHDQLLDAPAAVVEEPVAVAVEDAPAVVSGSSVAELEARVAGLEQQLRVKREALESLALELDQLRARVAAQLD